MLRLSSDQIVEMNRRAVERSAVILAKILRESFPHRVGDMGDPELLDLVRRTMDEARGEGLSTDGDIDLYVHARVYIGPSFPEATPELHSTLTNTRLNWDTKAWALAAAMEEADRVAEEGGTSL